MQAPRTPITWELVRTRVNEAPTAAAQRHQFAAASAPQILSDTKRGLARLLMQRHALSYDDARQRVLSEQDLRHLLPLAPEAARQSVLEARGNTPSARAAARNAAARCRQAVRVVDANLLGAPGHQRDHSAAAPAAWRPLLDALDTGNEHGDDAQARQRKKARGVTRACLLRVAQLLTATGIDSPEGLPCDPDHLAAQWRQAGMTPHVINNLLYAVRKARRVAEGAGLDVSRIPSWDAKRLGAGYSRYDVDWRHDPRAGLTRDLPLWEQWLQAWLTASKSSVSPSTQKTVAQAVCRTAYALKLMSDAGRLGAHDLRALTPFDLCERQVGGVRIGEAATAVVERNEIASTVGLRHVPNSVPLIHAVTAFLMRDKPIRRVLVTAKEIVPPGVRHDLEHTWMIVRTLIREEMLRQDATRWSAADLHYIAWQKSIREMHVAAGSPSARNISKLLDHITLPQLIVLGLPWLDLVCLPSQQARITTARTAADRAAAMDTYQQTLFRWAALAVPAAAPLRLDQFQFGRIGLRQDREFEVQASFDADGQLTSVERMTVRAGGPLHHFPDNQEASLKQRLAPMTAWVCRPSILNLRRFAEYLRTVWWARTKTRGLDRGRTMQEALRDGDLSLFLSDRNGSEINRWGGYGGNGADLADAHGEALLLIMREALGRTVPACKADALKAGWSYLLTEHTVRHQFATYWYGLRKTHAVLRRVDETTAVVRSGSQIAQEATRDSEKMLAKTYARVTETMAAHLDRTATSWEHPYVFNNWMDEAEDPNHVIDWGDVWNTLVGRCYAGFDALPPALREAWEQVRAHGQLGMHGRRIDQRRGRRSA
jgi:hypothetical protein